MATYEIDKIKLPNGDIVTLAGGTGSVYDAALTIKKGTATVTSAFTANASVGVTVTFATGTVLSSASLTGSETAIDTTKFNGGSFTRGTFTANTPTSFSVSGGTSLASPGALIITAGTAASHTADSFTPASFNTGFYTAGTLGLSTSTMTVLSNVS